MREKSAKLLIQTEENLRSIASRKRSKNLVTNSRKINKTTNTNSGKPQKLVIDILRQEKAAQI